MIVMIAGMVVTGCGGVSERGCRTGNNTKCIKLCMLNEDMHGCNGRDGCGWCITTGQGVPHHDMNDL